MRNLILCAIALSCAAPVVGQSADGGAPVSSPLASVPMQRAPRRPMAPPEKRPPAPEEVPSATPVVTLEGVCDHATAAGKSCRTAITRAQMDSLCDMLMPGASPEARRQFTVRYARLLAASSAAEKKHLEKNPTVANVLQTHEKFTRMQVMASALYSQMQQQATTVPVEEIQKYYKDHIADFEAGQFRRLSLPTTPQSPGAQAPDFAVLKAKAADLRARVVSGADFDQLQASAYQDLDFTTPLPPTTMRDIRRTELPQDQQKAFDLKPGEVSEVFDSFTGLVILKMEAKHTLPFESAQPEISSLMQRDRLRQQLRQNSQSIKAQFNLNYLGMSSQPELFPPQGVNQGLTAATAAPGARYDPRSRMASRRRQLPEPAPLMPTQK